MKKILVICDFFPPGFAPRMGYLVKYLKKFGYESIVLSTDILTRDDNANFDHLTNYSLKTYFVRISNKEQAEYLENQNRISEKVWGFLKPDYNRPPGLNEKMLNVGRRILEDNSIELILSSTSSIFPMDVAFILSKSYKIPWIADIRDITEQGLHRNLKFREKLVQIRSILRRNFLLNKAHFVITVSNWHKEKLFSANSRIKVIFNGYDPELYYFKEPQRTEKFTITYTGTVLTVKHYQDPTFFFLAMQKLDKEKIIDKTNFQVSFYTYPVGIEYIMNEAIKYNVFEYFKFSEFVPADQIPNILHSSSILLMFAAKCTPKGPNGVLTTKLFEYLGTGRPILCVESDRCDIENVIQTYEVGLAALNVEQVYQFVKSKFQEWKKFGFTKSIAPSNKDKEVFSRREQAKTFSEIFDSILKVN